MKCGIIGVDAAGNAQAWAPREGVRREAGRDGGRRDRRGVRGRGHRGEIRPRRGLRLLPRDPITSPYDGRVLGWDEATGRYWQLFVNWQEASSVGASDIELSAGDVVVWAYSSYGQGVPEVSESIEVKCGIIGVDAAGNARRGRPRRRST